RRLEDIADQSISITGYERRQSRYDEGTFLVLSVVMPSEPGQSTVKVTTGATVVMERIVEFFEEHPTGTLEAVITKRTGRQGREYWAVMDPDEYERQQGDGRAVCYPTRGERLVQPADVVAKVD